MLFQDGLKLSKHIGYVGLGTVESLVLEDNFYYFLEMNTRLQVEHTITEMVTGINIVNEQIKVCSEEKIRYFLEDIMNVI